MTFNRISQMKNKYRYADLLEKPDELNNFFNLFQLGKIKWDLHRLSRLPNHYYTRSNGNENKYSSEVYKFTY